MAQSSKATPTRPRRLSTVEQWNIETDVAIVGFGGAGACAAIEASDAGAEVWGVLYRITRADLLVLDATEGVPGRRYRQIWLAAEDAEGRAIDAVTYMADGNPEDGNPSLRYITLLRDGAAAHGLPAAYLDYLNNVEPAS